MFIRTFGNILGKFSFSSMGSYKKVTHVIFDLDGLLLDTEILYKKAYSEVMKQFGKEYLPDVQLTVQGTMEMDTARIIIEMCKLPVTPVEFNKLAKEEQRKVLGEAELKPGAERLINHFYNNNIPIAVATSSGEQSVKLKTWNHKDFMSKFHHIVMASSDPEVAKGKPAPDVFLVAAKRFEVPPKPEECLVFEDAPNGVKAAISAGMQVVMVPEDHIPPELKQEATLVVNSLNDFKPELFGLPPFPAKN